MTALPQIGTGSLVRAEGVSEPNRSTKRKAFPPQSITSERLPSISHDADERNRNPRSRSYDPSRVSEDAPGRRKRRREDIDRSKSLGRSDIDSGYYRDKYQKGTNYRWQRHETDQNNNEASSPDPVTGAVARHVREQKRASPVHYTEADRRVRFDESSDEGYTTRHRYNQNGTSENGVARQSYPAANGKGTSGKKHNGVDSGIARG